MTYVLSINHTRIISLNKYLSLGLQLYLHRQVLDKNEDVHELHRRNFTHITARYSTG